MNECFRWSKSIFGWLVIFDEPNGWKSEKLISKKHFHLNKKSPWQHTPLWNIDEYEIKLLEFLTDFG